jgi:tRNA(Arg) A34 adenosine deaminase TadA
MAANVGAKVVCIEATKTRDLQERQWDKVDWEMWWKERKAGLQKFNCEGKGVSPNIDLQKEERIGKHNGFHSVHRIYMMVSCGLTSNRALTGVGSGQRIGAVLVSKHGELLAWGVNTHNTEGNLTYHAEVNMLQSYQELCGDNFNGLPEDCRIYTTLKPCKMCAGMIVKCAAGKFKVFYDQHDPGGLASSTALDALKDHQSQLYTGGSVLDIKGVETDQNKGRSLPPMGSQLQDKYRQVRESKKKESDEKRITEFLTNDPLATQLFGNAVASLRDKLKKHGISPPNSNVTKTLNPVVTDALRHLDGFLRLKGVVV